MTIFIERARLRYGRIGAGGGIFVGPRGREAGVAITPRMELGSNRRRGPFLPWMRPRKVLSSARWLGPISTRAPLLLGSYHGDDFAPGLSQYQARAGSNG